MCNPHVDTSLKVSVPESEVQYQDGNQSKPFTAYRIVCTEDGGTWECCRRWNDLKIAHQEVQRDCASALHEARDRIPKFEQHSWRLGSSHLDAAFRAGRCKAMQELVQALVDELGVSVKGQTGPDALRLFLAEGGLPGIAGTPAKMTFSGDPLTLIGEAEGEPPSTPLPEPPQFAPVAEDAADTDAAPSPAEADESVDAVEPDEREEKPSLRSEEPEPPVASREDVEEPKGSPPPPSWLTIVLWTSIVLLPVIAIIAKEIIGVRA